MTIDQANYNFIFVDVGAYKDDCDSQKMNLYLQKYQYI